MSKKANATEQELKRYLWLTRYLRLKDTHSNLEKKFSKDDGGDIMDMECDSRRSENEVENKHQLRVGLLETACNMKTSSSNLK